MSEDVISRQEAINAVLRNLNKEEYRSSWESGAVKEMKNTLEKMPSADRPQKKLAEALAPYTTREDLIRADVEGKGYAEGFKDGLEADRPQGEWIDRGMRVPSSWFKKCSLCGYETDTWRWCNFCPNCGARMKGTDDE